MIARIAKIVAVNLAVFAVLAGIAELTFGKWFSTDPLDELGLPRGTKTIVSAQSLYEGGGDFVYRRDHWGLRGPDVDPARYTILTLGGSTTNQLYLPEEKTWQAVMEQAFRADGRNDVLVANGGIDGQSTIGHLQGLRDWIPHIPGLKPRFVLAYVGLNDVQLGGSWIDTLRHYSAKRIIQQKSALVRMWRTLRGMVVAYRAKLRHNHVDYAAAKWTGKSAQPIPVPPENIAAYKQRLSAMAKAIHDMGAAPVFVTQTRGDFRFENGKLVGMVMESGPNGVDQYNSLEPFNQATRAVCREEGLLCLDLARELKFESGDFYDYLHNTPAGAEKIGRWLYEKLAGLV